MLKILIVEDDSQLATTLKYLVEDNPRYRVVAIADEADSAVEAAQAHHPDLALVDLVTQTAALVIDRWRSKEMLGRIAMLTGAAAA